MKTLAHPSAAKLRASAREEAAVVTKGGHVRRVGHGAHLGLWEHEPRQQRCLEEVVEEAQAA